MFGVMVRVRVGCCMILGVWYKYGTEKRIFTNVDYTIFKFHSVSITHLRNTEALAFACFSALLLLLFTLICWSVFVWWSDDLPTIQLTVRLFVDVATRKLFISPTAKFLKPHSEQLSCSTCLQLTYPQLVFSASWPVHKFTARELACWWIVQHTLILGTLCVNFCKQFTGQNSLIDSEWTVNSWNVWR